MSTRGRLTLAGILLASVAAPVAASMAQGQPAASSDATTITTPQVDDSQAAFDSARGVIAAFGRDRQAGDAIPDTMSRSPLLDDGVANVAMSRRVESGAGAWILPATSGKQVCILVPGALACPTIDEIQRTGASIGYSWHAGEPTRIFGIVADGVSSVQIAYADGTTQQVDVAQNHFVVSGGRQPTTASWVGPAGRQTFTFAFR
jgi:hypothetical protein